MTFKKFLRRSLRVLGLYVLVWTLGIYAWGTTYRHCDDYTDHFDGGLHEIAGQTYGIRICGKGRQWVEDGSDEAVFQVYNMAGELLAERHFIPRWGRQIWSLEYESNRILYYNDGGPYWAASLNMPPTWLDWIRARLYPIPPFDALMAEVDHWFHRKVEPPQQTPCEGCRIEEVAPEDVPEALRRAGIRP